MRTAGLEGALLIGAACAGLMLAAMPAAAQRKARVTGQNLERVTFPGGSYVKTGESRWIVLDTEGRQQFELKEELRNSQIVLLRDRSRRIDVRLDVARMKIQQGRIAGTLRDVGSIREVFADAPAYAERPPALVRADRATVAVMEAPAVPAVSDLIEMGNGPIADRQDAEGKCARIAARVGGSWTGAWRTVERNRLALCTIRLAP